MKKIEQYTLRLREGDLIGRHAIELILDAYTEDIAGLATVDLDQLRLAARQLLKTLEEMRN